MLDAPKDPGLGLVIDWDAVHRPVEIRRRAHFDAASKKTRKQVISVRDPGCRVAGNECRSGNCGAAAPLGRLSHQRLRDTFALRVAEVQSSQVGEWVIALQCFTRGARGIANGKARKKVKRFCRTGAGETKQFTRANDVHISQILVWSHPIDCCSCVIDRTNRSGGVNEISAGHSQPWLSDIAVDTADPRRKVFFPEPVLL